ncbi:unnamed protein product [Spirodela intermedia]|uniref:DUF1995 domain-containing protein n=1 Tax=Spirodela intermedia TaxID=51605 RepID=A0A7I8IG54_SPIIN|nr:unnamed protein product [Spirodela intermedia]CAA6655852.1 unnamed protein product [Spirodela intermedia]
MHSAIHRLPRGGPLYSETSGNSAHLFQGGAPPLGPLSTSPPPPAPFIATFLLPSGACHGSASRHFAGCDLPCDLEDSIRQSARASALFVSSGGMRAIVELLIPQLQFLDSEGAQEELWGLTRIFVDTIIQETGGNQRVKAIFPDTGAAALLQYQWKDAEFGFASLSDRKPVEDGDDIVVMLVPDYQMLEYVEKIASRLSDDPPRPLIMWNPRLVSEDVGVGFNVRNLRKYFLSTFTTVYSMRPMPSGAIFRCYPGMWKVFYDDKDRPNRYRLAKEQASRPDATDLEQIFGEIAEKSEGKPSMFDKALGMISSMNRFMKAISK